MADILIRGIGNIPVGQEFVIVENIDFERYLYNRETGAAFHLVHLPEGHGRMIDADAIVAEMKKQITERDKIMELCKRARDMKNYFRCSNNQTEIASFMRMLNNAPTIVPAEGETSE